ncbi:CocE/NonD family hydrolase [Aliikangiella marina]|uniref:CocE/NonD family hydrolase n=1 Tax=Aliikangiella marina TaxID=1712262 RepID=UPI00163D61CD|nr:CocE/NonD family hydrolase [Aliikangiella marina]
MLFIHLHNRLSHFLLHILVTLVLLLNSFNEIYASDTEQTKNINFELPKTLVKSSITDQTDVVKLLASNQFANELRFLANQLDGMKLTDIAFDHKLGLRSILGQKALLLTLIEESSYPLNQFHYSIHARACMSQTLDCDAQLSKIAIESFANATDDELLKMVNPLGWSLSLGQDYLLWLFTQYQTLDKLSPRQALNLISNYQLYQVYAKVLPQTVSLIEHERNKRFEVQPNVLINTPDGATISAIIVRKKNDNQKHPTAFQFTIYADKKWNTLEAMYAASRGYTGVIAYTRGKAGSPDEIVPWEHDGKDAHSVIDWITKQPWSDGRVAMYGGSYLGFTQWAAAKYMHPALKTIVPYAAAHPFTGLPVENNIFITPNYQWSFHVTNNKTMDHSVYENPQYWQDVYTKLFKSGRPFKDIDKIEGTPNPWFQKLLKHPSYDEFYQDMLPYEEDFAKINIPVLSITGYFDGASISAIDFLKRHYQYNPNAEHYLLTGPYTHGTAQGIPRSHVGTYKLDPVALEKDTKQITFEWFDHVLHGKPKPKLIKDKINYQLLGSNTWQHKPSYAALNNQHVGFYLSSNLKQQGQLRLTREMPKELEHFALEVDLSDRETQHNVYSWQFIHQTLDIPNGLVFTTDPFQSVTELAGEVSGYFSIAINKRDVDIGFKLYEVKPDGSAYQLTRYISRASYAKNMSKRELLVPGVKTQIPIINSRMIGKQIEVGSRLVLILNVNKNSGAQVNMGTGKDVSEESIADAGEPLEIKWFSDSKINIPLNVQN